MDKENKKIGKWMPHWVDGGHFGNKNLYGCHCSLCGYWHVYEPWPKFCPKCKAELKEPF